MTKDELDVFATVSMTTAIVFLLVLRVIDHVWRVHLRGLMRGRKATSRRRIHLKGLRSIREITK